MTLSAYVVSGTQTLNVEYGIDVKKIQILNISGLMVKEVYGSSSFMPVDLSTQSDGVYFVRVYGLDSECSMSKLIKK